VAQGRPSSPRGAVWQNLGGLWIERRSQGRPARLGQTSGTGWRRDVLIQLTRNVAEQHLFWLVQVVARRKVDAAETTATPDHRTRATTGPASAALARHWTEPSPRSESMATSRPPRSVSRISSWLT